MLAVLLLSALETQPQTIFYSHPRAHSSVVLEALGKELGVPMKPSRSVMRVYVIVRFQNAPVDEAAKRNGGG